MSSKKALREVVVCKARFHVTVTTHISKAVIILS